jgi:hypothetical protein
LSGQFLPPILSLIVEYASASELSVRKLCAQAFGSLFANAYHLTVRSSVRAITYCFALNDGIQNADISQFLKAIRPHLTSTVKVAQIGGCMCLSELIGRGNERTERYISRNVGVIAGIICRRFSRETFTAHPELFEVIRRLFQVNQLVRPSYFLKALSLQTVGAEIDTEASTLFRHILDAITSPKSKWQTKNAAVC